MAQLTLFTMIGGVVMFSILAVVISLLAPIASYAFAALPFGLIFSGAAVMAIIFFLSKLTPNDASEIIMAMVAIWLTVMLVLLVVSRFCMNIRPTEHFEDKGALAVEDERIPALEKQVCQTLTDIEEYVKSKYGQEGIDNPSLVENSMYLMAEKCAPRTGSSNSRIQAMERSLGLLLEQPLYQATVALECDPPAIQAPRLQKWRLDRIEKQIEYYRNTYLKPLTEAQNKLKTGVISQKCKDLAKKT
jgi:hypothetical protein